MSKGTAHKSLRIDSELANAIAAAAAAMDPPLSMSDWIRLAACEKLDKIQRGRRNSNAVTWVTLFFDRWHNPDGVK